MKTAIVFSGQGSQTVGMGFDFYQNFTQSKEVFEEVDETLRFPLSKIIFEGPEDILNQTQYTQPAVMAVSMAILRVMDISYQFTAGHSLGEYSALCATKSLTLKDTAWLLQQRGKSFSSVQGSMSVVLGLPLNQVREAAEKTGVFVANENSALQTVISGVKENILKANDLVLSMGAKRTILLPVSGPFHSQLMLPAQQTMRPIIEQADIKEPVVPVVSNVDAQTMTKPEDIKEKLIQQMVCPVRWQACVQTLIDKGVDCFVEVGAGRVLTGLIKRINPDVKTYSVNCIQDLDNL